MADVSQQGHDRASRLDRMNKKTDSGTKEEPHRQFVNPLAVMSPIAAAAAVSTGRLKQHDSSSSLLARGSFGSATGDIVRLLPTVTLTDKLRALGTAVGSFALASGLSSLIVFIPLASPDAGLAANWVFVFVYFGLLTSFYAWSLLLYSGVMLAFSLPVIRSRWFVMVVPVLAGIGSPVLYCLTSQAMGEFPVPLAFVPFLLNLLLAAVIMGCSLLCFYHCRCCTVFCLRLGGRSKTGAVKNDVKWYHVVMMMTTFMAGWALGISYIHFFRAQSATVQTAMIVGLHVWKVSAIFSSEFLIEMTCQLDVPVQRAFASASIHWCVIQLVVLFV